MQDEANTKTEDKTTTNSAVTKVSVQQRPEGMLETTTVTLGTTQDNEMRQEENNDLNTTNEFTHATTDSEATTTMSMKDVTAMQSEQEQPRKQTRGLESSNQKTTVWGLSEPTTEASQQTEIHQGTTNKSRLQSERLFGTTDSAMTSDYTKFNKQRHTTTVEDSLQRISFSSTVQNGLQTDGENSMTTARNGANDSRELSWSSVEFRPNSTPMPTGDKPTESQLDLQKYTTMNKMELSTVGSQVDSTSVKYTTKEDSETGDSKETTIHNEALTTVTKKAEARTETIMPYTYDEFIQSSTTPEDEKLGFPLGSTVSNDFETESRHHMVTEMDNDGASGTQRWSTREGNHQITRKSDMDVITDGHSMASKDMQHTLTTEGTIDDDLDANTGEEFLPTRETAHPVTTNGNIDVNSRQNHMSTIDMQHPITTNTNIDDNSGEEFTSTREIEHQVTTRSNIETGFKDNSMSTRDLEDPMTTNSNMDVTSGQNHMATRDIPHLMTTNSNIDVASGEKPMSTRVIEHPIQLQ